MEDYTPLKQGEAFLSCGFYCRLARQNELANQFTCHEYKKQQSAL